MILQEIGVPLRTYFASASVIGLAVGFGLQGFVQDVIIGLTLIFSDVINVGDMVDLSGQSGRVVRIGLRFTTLVNVLGQEVNVSNRNIVQIKFRTWPGQGPLIEESFKPRVVAEMRKLDSGYADWMIAVTNRAD